MDVFLPVVSRGLGVDRANLGYVRPWFDRGAQWRPLTMTPAAV